MLVTENDDVHLVVEAHARRVDDDETLQRASTAFDDVYGWPTTVVGDEIDAPYAAPTSGGPPFQVWELTPVKAFGFPADGESSAPTRWTFDTSLGISLDRPERRHDLRLDEDRSGGC